jgi:ATP-dependent DNA helicase RecG
VTLLNMERPSIWDEVSDWIDRHGSIANRELREISGLDTLEASRMLRAWVSQGVLIALPAASRQQARYAKPERPETQPDLLSGGSDNDAEFL